MRCFLINVNELIKAYFYILRTLGIIVQIVGASNLEVPNTPVISIPAYFQFTVTQYLS